LKRGAEKIGMIKGGKERLKIESGKEFARDTKEKGKPECTHFWEDIKARRK